MATNAKNRPGVDGLGPASDGGNLEYPGIEIEESENIIWRNPRKKRTAADGVFTSFHLIKGLDYTLM
jgi:hypothetical protein